MHVSVAYNQLQTVYAKGYEMLKKKIVLKRHVANIFFSLFFWLSKTVAKEILCDVNPLMPSDAIWHHWQPLYIYRFIKKTKNQKYIFQNEF
jgi:hypothetical protein